MQEPMFTETMQIAIVVRDLDATIRRYVEDFGIGSWQTHEISSADIKDLREYGRHVEHSWRVAVARIGSVMWELIEPLDQEGMYARFLAEKGEGIHHVALATSKFDELVAIQLENGTSLSGAASSAAPGSPTSLPTETSASSPRSSAMRPQPTPHPTRRPGDGVVRAATAPGPPVSEEPIDGARL